MYDLSGVTWQFIYIFGNSCLVARMALSFSMNVSRKFLPDQITLVHLWQENIVVPTSNTQLYNKTRDIFHFQHMLKNGSPSDTVLSFYY